MKIRDYVLVISLVHFLLYAAIGFDIPIMRQLLVFLYLSFIPGFVFLGVLKIGKTSLLDLVLYSVGLSIALVMFIGLFVNEAAFLLGFSQPLSTTPILLTMSGFTLVFFVVGCRRGIAGILDSITSANLSEIPAVRAIALLLLPVIGVVSVVFVKDAIFLIPIAIAALFVVCTLSTKLIPMKLYPLLIFSISLSLTLMTTLMSKHIMGQDSVLEYYVYKVTATNQYWLPITSGDFAQKAFSSMLSITILPTIFSNLLNLDGELLFKILYPIVFSVVPVVLYRILAKEGWKLTALLSSLFLVSSPLVFYGTYPMSLNRQLIGSVFLLLSVFVLVGKQFSSRNNQIILLIFGAAIAVSHYTISIIYLSFLVLVFVFVKIKKKPESLVSSTMLLMLFGVTFFWYIVVQTGIIDSLSGTISNILSSFNADLFDATARPNVLFTTHPIQTFASATNWILYIGVHFFAIIGIITALLNKQDGKLDFKYRIMLLFCSTLLFLTIAVPNFSATLNFERFYEIAFLFLPPCFVIGGVTVFLIFRKVLVRTMVFRKVSVKKVNVAMLLIGLIMSAYFLSQYGFINKFAGGSPQSITLDWDRLKTSTDPQTAMNFYFSFTPEQDVASASWLSKFKTNSSVIYSDFVSASHPLKVFGFIPEANLMILHLYDTTLESNSYIYLRDYNVISGFVIPYPNLVFNTSELSTDLNNCNCVYTNGESMVYASKVK